MSLSKWGRGPIFSMLTRAETSHGSNDAPCTHCSETPCRLHQLSNDLVACGDPLSAFLQPSIDNRCDHPDQYDYEIEYADHYSSLGVLVRDIFLLSVRNGNQLKVRMALGCGYDQVFLAIFFGDLLDSSRVTRIPMSPQYSKYSPGAAEPIVEGGQPALEIRFFHYCKFIFDTCYYEHGAVIGEGIDWKAIERSTKRLEHWSLDLCWRGRKPFKSVPDVRKYFKPVTVKYFPRGGRAKAQFEIPPEAYLIISNKGNVCLGILNGVVISMQTYRLGTGKL